jgi:hypothetical protein
VAWVIAACWGGASSVRVPRSRSRLLARRVRCPFRAPPSCRSARFVEAQRDQRFVWNLGRKARVARRWRIDLRVVPSISTEKFGQRASARQQVLRAYGHNRTTH